jgi:hypothetical protein
MILEASRVKEHFPGLRVCISIASFRFRPTAPTSVLNSPMAENDLSLCPIRWLERSEIYRVTGDLAVVRGNSAFLKEG